MGKHLSQTSPTGDMFYDDLISEILVRLPVKSLLRFKSVSKSWFSLISNPNFKKSHLRFAIEKAKAEQTLIIREDRVSDKLICNDDTESDTLISLLDLNSCEVVADLNFPYSKGEVPSLRSSFVVGSACGIVCVCVDMRSPDSFEHRSNFADGYLFIYLWNPATKQSKLIPPCTTIRDDIKNVSVGFGYDPIGDDFKVVRVSSAFVEVYSTNRNAWTKVVDPNPIDVPYDNIFNCCINGYVCSTGRSDNMIAFDLNKEVLNCGIRFPVTSYFDARITDYNDRIAVIIWWEREMEENQMRMEKEGNDIVWLWTLDDEACLCDGRVKASWTLKLSVEIDFVSDFVYGYFRVDLLLMVVGVWILYNCETKEKICIQAPYVRDEIFKYTESLVSIEGSKQVSWDGNWIQDQGEDEGEGEGEFMFEYDYDYEDEDEGEDEVEFDYGYEDENGVAVEDEDEGEFDYVYEGEDGVAVEDEDADEDED